VTTIILAPCTGRYTTHYGGFLGEKLCRRLPTRQGSRCDATLSEVQSKAIHNTTAFLKLRLLTNPSESPLPLITKLHGRQHSRQPLPPIPDRLSSPFCHPTCGKHQHLNRTPSEPTLSSSLSPSAPMPLTSPSFATFTSPLPSVRVSFSYFLHFYISYHTHPSISPRQ